MIYDNNYYDNYGNPTIYNRINIEKTIINNQIRLDDTPRETDRVNIIDENNIPMNEINIKQTITLENQYKVNYKDSYIYFHDNKENKIVKCTYVATGQTIATTDFNNNKDISGINYRVNIMETNTNSNTEEIINARGGEVSLGARLDDMTEHTHSADEIVDGINNKVLTANDKTKLGNISVTSSVDLNALLNTSEVVTEATANKILKLNTEAKLPTSITGDSASVGSKTASGELGTTEKVNLVTAINELMALKGGSISIYTKDGSGVAMCGTDHASYIIYAQDTGFSSSYLLAIGVRNSTVYTDGLPKLNVLHSNVLALGASNNSGTQVINGASAENIKVVVICIPT